jgi:S-adenosylmethionine hydrolase
LHALVALPASAPSREPGRLVGRVDHVDRFGNAITDLTAADLAGFAAPVVEAAGRRIVGLSHHYAEREGLLALVGSADRLEVAVNGGSAAAELGLRTGDPVVVCEADSVAEGR